jgi:hypothetical protein
LDGFELILYDRYLSDGVNIDSLFKRATIEKKVF